MPLEGDERIATVDLQGHRAGLRYTDSARTFIILGAGKQRYIWGTWSREFFQRPGRAT